MPASRRRPSPPVPDVRRIGADERVALLDRDDERALVAHRAVVADLADGADDPAAAGRLYDAVRRAWSAQSPPADPEPLVEAFTTALGDLVLRLVARGGVPLRHGRLVPQPHGPVPGPLVLTDPAGTLVVALESTVRRGWQEPGSGWLTERAVDLADAALVLGGVSGPRPSRRRPR
ncbi:hypothetical protein [Cellulomonas marina]|uniref:Uncharacterized protein n=1 Tax=Cellulomonas marina TaxID=988821 RepID=A0A1I0WN93_9CELL|nr:hypothetical protein [Cellulomonas marina]GIG27769.1 hypothetical protein Cma02nite_03690 [Cellulomonas marina]SFA90219.1 hypothetical protein SAMN05421867_103118 [Cellulomonas marina]